VPNFAVTVIETYRCTLEADTAEDAEIAAIAHDLSQYVAPDTVDTHVDPAPDHVTADYVIVPMTDTGSQLQKR
jgi:HD superfamily phosphohydrolase YqeK